MGTRVGKTLFPILLLSLAACTQCLDIDEECVPDETYSLLASASLRRRSLPWTGHTAWADEWEDATYRWNTTGWITVNLGFGTNDVVRAAVYQSDHKLLVVGRSHNGNYNDFALARFWPDGSPDSSFGTNGQVVTSFGEGEAIAHAVALDTQGRIVVAGRRWGFTGFDLGVSRYLSNGTPDTSFGTLGHVLVDSGVHEFARGVVIDSVGRIGVVGYAQTAAGSWNFAVARLTTSGALDTTFSTDGIHTFDFPGNEPDVAYAALVDSADRIIAVGRTVQSGVDNDFAVARILTNGNLDSTFSADGMHFVDSPSPAGPNTDDVAWAACFDDAQRIWLAGRTRRGGVYELAVARLTTLGVDNGATSFALGSGSLARGIAMADDAQLVLGGRAWDGTDWHFAAARFNSSGALDANFDTDGLNTASITGNDDIGYALAYHRGKMAVGGTTNNGSDLDFAIVRFNSNGAHASSGAFDAHLNVTGFTTSDFNGDIDTANGLARDSLGRYVVAGFRENGAVATRNFAVARYTSNGVADASFNGSGFQNTDFNGDNDEAWDVAVDSLDRPVLVGFRENGTVSTRDFAVARYTTGGVLDTTFNGTGTATLDYLTDQDEARAVAIDSLNRPVLVGFRETAGGAAGTRRFAVARFTSTGAIDTTFATTGFTTYVFTNDRAEANAVSIDSLGRIYVAGMRENGAVNTRDFAILRLLTNGVLDSANFGTNGLQNTDFGGLADLAEDMALDTLGRPIVVGYATNATSNWDFAIARYTTAGVLDNGFSGDGRDTVDNGNTVDRAFRVRVQRNGKIVVFGVSGSDLMLVRYHTDGTRDSSFGTNGIRVLDPTAATDAAGGLFIEEDDRIVGSGTTGAAVNFLLFRLWP